jgi:hypothetical protein
MHVTPRPCMSSTAKRCGAFANSPRRCAKKTTDPSGFCTMHRELAPSTPAPDLGSCGGWLKGWLESLQDIPSILATAILQNKPQGVSEKAHLLSIDEPALHALLCSSTVKAIVLAISDNKAKVKGPDGEARAACAAGELDDTFQQLRQKLSDDVEHQSLLSQVEADLQDLRNQLRGSQWSNVQLEQEMGLIQEMGTPSVTEEETSRFAAIPSDFKLSYGSHDDFEKGLTALVGAPVSNAAELEKAVKDEHRHDPAFQIWSNQFQIMYQVCPLNEYHYCQGAAQEGGHDFPTHRSKEGCGSRWSVRGGFYAKLHGRAALLDCLHA